MKSRWIILTLISILFNPCFCALVFAHTDVTAQQAKNMIDTNDELIVVDVRELSEYCGELGHVPGALNYPWNSNVLQTQYEDFGLDDEILVYCHSGYRGNLAAEFLDSKGYQNVYDMLGAILAWEWETAGCVGYSEYHP